MTPKNDMCQDSTLTPGSSLLSPLEVAERLSVPLGTVYRWRSNGVGPRAYKVGKHVRYRLADVEAWLEERVAPRGAA